jgi:hypothetical protein
MRLFPAHDDVPATMSAFISRSLLHPKELWNANIGRRSGTQLMGEGIGERNLHRVIALACCAG